MFSCHVVAGYRIGQCRSKVEEIRTIMRNKIILSAKDVQQRTTEFGGRDHSRYSNKRKIHR